MDTPKERMLKAYRGVSQDRPPVAPEFWYYYPARILGIPMIEFEREIPFWQSLQKTFKRYGCEGFGIAFSEVHNPGLERRAELSGWEETVTCRYRGSTFTQKKMYDRLEPSWLTKRLAQGEESPAKAVEMLLAPENTHDFSAALRAHEGVGGDYLLEMWAGVPFFDFFAETMGFEEAVMYFTDEDEQVLEAYLRRYVDYQRAFVRSVARETPFESVMIGCSYSCASLLGMKLWRRWDKPYLRAVVDEIHRCGLLAHAHFHGRSLEAARDFAELGLDCVCPFERAPGGDVSTAEQLLRVREALKERVTFNGNVHTVETLIRGDARGTRAEVRQIKEAFRGSNRLIVGTGDQVGRETREDNLWAMIEEAKNGTD
jgi:hypothetical protein